MEFANGTGAVALALVTSAGTLVTVCTDHGWTLPQLPAGQELLSWVRSTCQGEVSGLHVVPLSAADRPVTVVVARMHGHAPGHWIWREGQEGLRVRELGFDAAGVAHMAQLHPAPVGAWLTEVAAGPLPLEELLGPRAGRPLD